MVLCQDYSLTTNIYQGGTMSNELMKLDWKIRAWGAMIIGIGGFVYGLVALQQVMGKLMLVNVPAK